MITPIRSHLLAIALSLVAASVGFSCSTHRVANDQAVPGKIFQTDAGRQVWMTTNLNVRTDRSYCYDDTELNCRRFGRLYTWESAQRGCQSLGNGWRLPRNDEWRQLAKHYSGVYDQSDDSGKAAYEALLIEGTSGFDARLGGGRAPDGQYARVDAHGFYWTASETDSASAWFYNFGRGGRSLYRHSDGEKQRAFSVRCVWE